MGLVQALSLALPLSTAGRFRRLGNSGHQLYPRAEPCTPRRPDGTPHAASDPLKLAGISTGREGIVDHPEITFSATKASSFAQGVAKHRRTESVFSFRVFVPGTRCTSFPLRESQSPPLCHDSLTSSGIEPIFTLGLMCAGFHEAVSVSFTYSYLFHSA